MCRCRAHHPQKSSELVSVRLIALDTDAGFKAILNRLQVEFKSRGGERFHFHDLRAKYVTDKEERGEDSSQGTGHKNRATVERTYDRRRIRKATPAQ